jgi:hypothetical protein
VRHQLGRLRQAEFGVEAAEKQQELRLPHPGTLRQRQSQTGHPPLRHLGQIHLRGNFLQVLFGAQQICMQVRPQARGKLAAVVEECSEIHQLDKCMEWSRKNSHVQKSTFYACL